MKQKSTTEYEQLKLGIQYRNKNLSERIVSSLSEFKYKIGVNPYWKNGYSWLSLLSCLILGTNSLLLIYLNFEKLPQRIAMMFAEKIEEDIVKDKYLLYLLPLFVMIIGILISIISEKIFTRYPQVTKFISIITFLMSLIQLISVYKIITIYS